MADYPVVDTEVAPPVTLEIRVDKISGGVSETISSDINSDDIESRKDQGSEKFQSESAWLENRKV